MLVNDFLDSGVCGSLTNEESSLIRKKRFFYLCCYRLLNKGVRHHLGGARGNLALKVGTFLFLAGMPYQGVSAQGVSFDSAEKLLKLPKYQSIREILGQKELYRKHKKAFDRRILLVLPFRAHCSNDSFSWLEQALAHRFAQGLRDFPVTQPELVTGQQLLPEDQAYLDLAELEKTLKNPGQGSVGLTKEVPVPPKGLRTVVWRNWLRYLPDSLQNQECTKTAPSQAKESSGSTRRQWRKIFASLMRVLYKSLEQAELEERVQLLLLGGDYYMQNQEPTTATFASEQSKSYVSIFLYDGSQDRILWHGGKEISLDNHELSVVSLLSSMKKSLRGGEAVLQVPELSLPYRVYVNERYIGRAPCSVAHLQKGRYKISLRYQFRSPREFHVNLGPGEKRVLALPQQKKEKEIQQGSLLVKASPKAYVYVNGKYAGQTPVAQKLDSGHHRLRLEREGYRSREQGLYLASGEDYQVSWQLNKQEGGAGQGQGYRVYEPYQGWNFFRNGSTYELASKYSLVFSVLSFTAAIVSDGLGKRKVDSTEDPTKINRNPYQVYTSVFLTSGLSSLVASGVFLYISLSMDERSFANHEPQTGHSMASAYGEAAQPSVVREPGGGSMRANLSLTKRF